VIELPFDEVILDEPEANTNSPFCKDAVTAVNPSNLPRLCFNIGAIHLFN
jgi:hypothetical protein